jgi:GTPase SAR1 family protein
VKPETIIQLENLLSIDFFENNEKECFTFSTDIDGVLTSIKLDFERYLFIIRNVFDKEDEYFHVLSLFESRWDELLMILSSQIFLNSLNINYGLRAGKSECTIILKSLINLEYLRLVAMSISDITPFNELIRLKNLDLSRNNLRNISIIENFKNLESLDLSSNQIKNVDSLSSLSELRKLNLRSNKIEDITTLYGLPELYELLLDNNLINHIDFQITGAWYNMHLLCTSNNPVKNIPIEIINDINGSKQGIVSFLCDQLSSGISPNNEVKVLLFGNGNVGKSQIAHRLCNLPFNEEYESTQKIDLFLSSLKDENTENPLNLNVWDFGGQDIYHVTHRVFMESRALFIIVWDHISEFGSHHSWNGDDYENYNLNYWIEYVNYHSPGSPILVVQNKIDCLEEGQALIVPASKNDIKEKYGYKIDFAEVCARPIDDQTINKSLTDDGIEILKSKILSIFRSNSSEGVSGITYNFSDPRLAEFKSSINIKWPKSWIEVVKEIREKQQNKEREIKKTEFYNLCTEIEKNNNYKISNQNELLNFLSNASILYYNEKYFDDKVVLDQEWFIEKIYKLFDRTKPYYKKLKGRIEDSQTALLSPSVINEIWPETSKEDIATYLNYLIKAEIILKLGSKGKYDWIEINKDSFFVPAFLPSTTPNLEKYKSVNKITNEKTLEFGFIPPVLIKKLMLNYMSYSKSLRIKDKWQKGLVIAFDNQLCIVTVDYLNPKLIIEYKDDSILLKNKINEEIELINKDSDVKIHETHDTLVYGFNSLNFDKKSNFDQAFSTIDKLNLTLNGSEYHLTPNLIQDLIITLGNTDSILEARGIFLNGNPDNFERLIKILESFVYEYRDTNINLNNVIMALENKKSEIIISNSGQGSTIIVGDNNATVPLSGSSDTHAGKNGLASRFKKYKWIILLFLSLFTGGTYILLPNKTDLIGNVIIGSKLDRDIISSIAIYGHPEHGRQVLNHGGKGDFIFRDFPKSTKIVKFLLTFSNNQVETTENFVVRKTENDLLTVDNIWVENKTEFETRNKDKNILQIPKVTTIINKNTINISQTNVNGDNVIDSTTIKIEK